MLHTYVVLLTIYVVGIVVCVLFVYRWHKSFHSNGEPIHNYERLTAVGLVLLWPIFWTIVFRLPNGKQ